MSFNDTAESGIKGVVYSVGLYITAIVLGMVDIVEAFFGGLATGIGNLIGSILTGAATTIQMSVESTDFLDLGPFGLPQGIAVVVAAWFILDRALDQFNTDIPFVPSFDIPFFGRDE